MADTMAEPSFGAGFDVREVLAGFRGIAEGLRDIRRDLGAVPSAATGDTRPPQQDHRGTEERTVEQAAEQPAQDIAALVDRLDALDEAVEQLRQSVERLEGVVGPATDQTQAARTAG